jgi:hypothetical protein
MSSSTEQAIRGNLHAHQELRTLSKGSKCVVAELEDDALILLLGATKNRTRIPWTDLDDAVNWLRGRGWERVAYGRTTKPDPETLDGVLQRHTHRATSIYVAAIFVHAGLAQSEGGSPLRIRCALA